MLNEQFEQNIYIAIAANLDRKPGRGVVQNKILRKNFDSLDRLRDGERGVKKQTR